MTAKIIDGKEFSKNLREKITESVINIKKTTGLTPGLAVILVGNDPASEVYVRNKSKQTQSCQMESFQFNLPETTTQENLIAKINELNEDEKVHGILVQLPLPAHIDEYSVINSIKPEKDVDGFHVINSGLLATGQNAMTPCTPLGCLMMLKETIGDMSGMHAVVVGRSNIVGKPMSSLLLKENCTVTIAHSHTKNIEEICQNADILIAAVGSAEIIKGSWIKEGATVIDVGINRITKNSNTRLIGDVEFESAKQNAGAITPVPGGVGPMTIACLLRNTLIAFCRIHNLSEPEI